MWLFKLQLFANILSFSDYVSLPVSISPRATPATCTTPAAPTHTSSPPPMFSSVIFHHLRGCCRGSHTVLVLEHHKWTEEEVAGGLVHNSSFPVVHSFTCFVYLKSRTLCVPLYIPPSPPPSHFLRQSFGNDETIARSPAPPRSPHLLPPPYPQSAYSPIKCYYC